jgi:uncharacterized integral membrane protein
MSTKNEKEKSEKEKKPEKGLYIRYRTIVWAAVILLLAILLFSTIIQNTDNTTIKFLFLNFSAPTIGVIAFSMMLGFIGGVMFGRHFFSKKPHKE